MMSLVRSCGNRTSTSTGSWKPRKRKRTLPPESSNEWPLSATATGTPRASDGPHVVTHWTFESSITTAGRTSLARSPTDRKPEPVIVTEVPPCALPCEGKTLSRCGGAYTVSDNVPAAHVPATPSPRLRSRASEPVDATASAGTWQRMRVAFNTSASTTLVPTWHLGRMPTKLEP
eukprot:scaffold35107_cov28-Tisochrysis_lutea.AAC.9